MKSLLLIEDDDAMRELLATALEFEGFTVHCARDGASGVAAARRYSPALIVCDVMMPGMDGYSVLAALRADPVLCVTPFIFLTAKRKKGSAVRHGERRGRLPDQAGGHR